MQWFRFIIASLGVCDRYRPDPSGEAMLFLNFSPQISVYPLALYTLQCLGRLLLYIIPCVLVLLPIRFLTKVPSFVFRKLLHIIAFTCFSVMVMGAKVWQAGVLTALLVALLVYPPLAILEKESWYGKLFVQKSPGEIKRSLLMLFLMFALVIAVAWGYFENLCVAVTAILMWGVGDAAAALVGIPLGRHKVKIRIADGKKSWEGSLAMLLASAFMGFLLLRLYGWYPLSICLGSVAVACLAGTCAELFTPGEWDTVTVPLVILSVLLLMV